MSSAISYTKGDMLGFKREFYWHYALYIGMDESGIHMVVNIPGKGKSSKGTKLEVVPLSIVVQGSKIEIQNNDEYAKKRFNRNPRTPEEIVSAAMEFVRQNKTWPYEFLNRNCEFYTSFFRYGIGFSIQADTAKKVALTGALAIGAAVFGYYMLRRKPLKRLQRYGHYMLRRKSLKRQQRYGHYMLRRKPLQRLQR